MSIEKVLNEVFDIYLTKEIITKAEESYKTKHKYDMCGCFKEIRKKFYFRCERCGWYKGVKEYEPYYDDMKICLYCIDELENGNDYDDID